MVNLLPFYFYSIIDFTPFLSSDKQLAIIMIRKKNGWEAAGESEMVDDCRLVKYIKVARNYISTDYIVFGIFRSLNRMTLVEDVTPKANGKRLMTCTVVE